MIRSDPSATRSTEGAQTVDRALRLLVLLGPGPHRGGLTISDIAREMGVGRPVVYRLVRSLAAHGFVRKRRDGRYTLGGTIARLASSVADELAAVALPFLRDLADDVGATAHLTLAHGEEAIAAAVVEPSWTTLHVTYRVGSRHPLSLGAGGRAIVRARGGSADLVTSIGELQGGATGVAIALPGIEWPEASVGLISLEQLDVRAVGPKVRIAAEAIATAYGSA